MRVRGRIGKDDESEDEGLETEWLQSALQWLRAQYDFIVAVLKSECAA